MVDDSKGTALDIEQLFLRLPLYESVSINPKTPRLSYLLEFFNSTVDSFCVECGRDSVFQASPNLPHIGPATHSSPVSGPEFLVNTEYSSALFRAGLNYFESRPLDTYAASSRFFEVSLSCIRESRHRMIFYFHHHEAKITKVGQFPSLSDLDEGAIRKYRPLLGRSQFAELHRAVGLASHGIGIGSYVYLRRIFESLIESAHEVAKQDAGWDETAFQQGRIDDKILLLRNHLPQFLVESRSILHPKCRNTHSDRRGMLGSFRAPQNRDRAHSGRGDAKARTRAKNC
jgi:hypothetical protein